MNSVTGCPSPGFYGENCDMPCSHNCQEGHCHIVEGNCLGCLPGYKGLTCIDGNENINNFYLNSISFLKITQVINQLRP